jgi:hypothetical protein
MILLRHGVHAPGCLEIRLPAAIAMAVAVQVLPALAGWLDQVYRPHWYGRL